MMVVMVDGVEIDEHKIQDEMTRLRSEYEAYVNREGGEAEEVQLREWAIENLIEASLFRTYAVAHQPIPSAERVRQELTQNAEAYQHLADEQRLIHAQETLQQRRLMRQIRKGVIPIEEQKIRDYYNANPSIFLRPESVQLSHICRYINPINRAEVMLELLRLKTNLDHSQITWDEALGAYSESYNKDYGIFATVARGDFSADIEAKIFTLQVGQISDVIDFNGGSLHLLRILKHLNSETIPFENVKGKLTDSLFEQACQDALNSMYDTLKASAVIQRKDV